MTHHDIADIRRDFSAGELIEENLTASPFELFGKWLDDALDAGLIDANAMTLATAGLDARPSVRIVLLKSFDERGFAFFTNYESKKGRDLAENPFASIHFFWAKLDRQVRIYGSVAKVTREESQAYFDSRPLESRIGAWASAQSRTVASREVLDERFAEIRAKYGDNVPLPPFWGGFRLTPDKFEFWQGRENRMHDRICYELSGSKWAISRLSP